jgi:hypothetical protein
VGPAGRAHAESVLHRAEVEVRSGTGAPAARSSGLGAPRGRIEQRTG